MATACGKFILGGEHSVVHEGFGLGFPVPALSLTVRETPGTEGLIINGQRRSAEELRRVEEVRRLVGAKRPVIGLEISSELPIGGGLGSSAALCTALARLHNPGVDGKGLAAIALEAERVFHGKPSGIDPFTIALGRPIAFRASDRFVRPLKTEAFRASGLVIALADSGWRHRTSEVLEAVSDLKNRAADTWKRVMEALSLNASRMIEAFEERPETLGQFMDEAQSKLRELGVSCEALEKTVSELRRHGALGAKLTGAGRGGYALGLFRESDVASLPPAWLIYRVLD